MALKAGSWDDLEDSMAGAIEEALAEQWQSAYGEEVSEAGRKDRRVLFSAIAQGVVNYLKAGAYESIRVVEVDVTQDDQQITSSGGLVTVTQDAGTGNRVRSTGTGKVVID